MAQTQEFIATGRRKTAVARIRMTAGTGKIEVNGKPFEEYFPTVAQQNAILQPLQVAKSLRLTTLRSTQMAEAPMVRPARSALPSPVRYCRPTRRCASR